MPPASPSNPGAQLKQAVLEASERVQEIIDAAEREALEVRRDAEREAEQYLASRRSDAERLVEGHAADIGEKLKPLVNRLERMHGEALALAGELETVLEEARGALALDPEAPPSEASHPPGAAEPAPSPSAGLRARLFERSRAAGAQRGPAASGAGPPLVHAFPGTGSNAVDAAKPEPPAADEQALLRATQMAVAGNDRGEIERVLQDELGIADPAPVVERVLGRG